MMSKSWPENKMDQEHKANRSLPSCLFLASLLILALPCMTVVSCTNPATRSSSLPENFKLALSGFPDDSQTWQIIVQSFDASDNLVDNFQFGPVSLGVDYKKDVSLGASAKTVGVYLEATNFDIMPSFFSGGSLETARLSDHEISIEYWLDYYAYFWDSKVKFGLSSSKARIFEKDCTLDLDYSAAPYYLFSFPPSAENIFSFDIGYDSTGSILRSFDSFEAYRANYYMAIIPRYGNFLLRASPNSATQLLATPVDYSHPTATSLSITDITADSAIAPSQTFESSAVGTIDDGMTFYFWSEDKLGQYKAMKKWDFQTGTVSTYSSAFQQSRMFVDSSTIYIVTSNELWTFEPSTGTFVFRMRFPYACTDFSIVGDYFLLRYGGSWKLQLIRKSDFAIVSTCPQMADTAENAVFFPEQKRIYLLSPDNGEIYNVGFDPSTESLGEYGGTSYKGSNSIYGAMTRLYGSDQLIVGCTGDIFEIDEASPGKLRPAGSLGARHFDIACLDEALLELRYDQDPVFPTFRCYLVSRDPEPPYAEIARVGFPIGDEGFRLIRASDGVYVVTRSDPGMYGRIRIQKFTFDELMALGAPSKSASVAALASLKRMVQRVP
jgi:hypothetical protein